MNRRKAFLYPQMALVVALYASAALHLLRGDTGHLSVIVAAVILGLHVLSVPVALRALKDQNPEPLRVVLMTLLFGVLWWVPARRGLWAVR